MLVADTEDGDLEENRQQVLAFATAGGTYTAVTNLSTVAL